MLGDTKSSAKAIKHNTQLKKEDIELIVSLPLSSRVQGRLTRVSVPQVSELEIPRTQAERALANAKGDVQLALRTLVTGSSE